MGEITMQDVRLHTGEGKLTPADVLAGCNAELRRRDHIAGAGNMIRGDAGDETRAIQKHPAWAIAPHTDIEPGVEARLNSDGTIDEILTDQPVAFHLEQMDDGRYWIGLSWTDAAGVERMQHIMLTRHRKAIYPTVYR